METLAAAAGVAGGAPPATVDMEYCCASAMEAPASSGMNLNMRSPVPAGCVMGHEAHDYVSYHDTVFTGS